MKSWQPTKIGDACVPTNQVNPDDLGRETFKYVDIASVDRIQKKITDAKTLDCSDAPSRARKLLQANDIIVATVRPNLNAVALVPDEFDGEICSTGFCVLRPNVDRILPKYLFFRTQSPEFVADLVSQTKGANYPAVNDGDVKNHEIPLPHPKEQAKIVEILDQADVLRQQRAAANQDATRLLPALFRHYFGDPITNPRNWPTEQLTKVCDPRQWPTITQQELTDSGYPVYGANGQIGYYSNYNHEFSTVLITCRGATCGTINVCPPKSYVTGNAMALDNPNPKKTSLEFLEAFLKIRGFKDVITGAAQPQITRANLEAVQVPKPDPTLLKEFSAEFVRIKLLEDKTQSSTTQLETLFQVLLQRAFDGRLTASWRTAHAAELLREMEHNSRIPTTSGVDY